MTEKGHERFDAVAWTLGRTRYIPRSVSYILTLETLGGKQLDSLVSVKTNVH